MRFGYKALRRWGTGQDVGVWLPHRSVEGKRSIATRDVRCPLRMLVYRLDVEANVDSEGR